MTQRIVSHEEWLAARVAFLEKEKAFTQAREELARERRELPWERIDKVYDFEGPEGRLTLADLFGDHSQLVVYHFMLGPDWKEGCPSCSFWADNYNGIDIHLAEFDAVIARDLRWHDLEIADLRRRLRAVVRFDVADDDVHAVLFQPVPLLEHRVSLAHARAGTEVDLPLPQLLAADD